MLVVITNPKSTDQYFGYITRVQESSARTSLHILVSDKFPIGQILKTKIKICLLEYIKVELETFSALEELRYFMLSRFILNPREIVFDRVIDAPSEYIGMEKLNVYQYEAMSLVTGKIERNRDTPHVFLIEGPPGTGKSRLIANMILQLFRNPNNRTKGFRILLCAPSNNAVDSLTEKLVEYRSKLKDEERRHFKLVRFGEKCGSKAVEIHSISNLLLLEVERECSRVASLIAESTDEQKERQNLLNEINTLYKKRETNLTYSESEMNKERVKILRQDLVRLEKKMYFMANDQRTLDQTKYKMKSNLLNGAKIITCTLTSCPSLANNSTKPFDIAIIDEATQATETACLMALTFGVKNMIMIGDTQQLPAMIRNSDAKNLGLGNSLFARIRAASETPNYLTLRTQYRMHPEILKFSNSYFYQNQILNGSNVREPSTHKLKPYLVFELESEQNFTQNPHCYNTDEIDFVINLLKTIKILIHPMKCSIGVVTPYLKQKQLIEAKLG